MTPLAKRISHRKWAAENSDFSPSEFSTYLARNGQPRECSDPDHHLFYELAKQYLAEKRKKN